MSETRELAGEHYRAFHDRDFGKASEIYSPDLTTVVSGSETMHGIEVFLAYVNGFTTAFPDARLETRTVTDGGDRVVIEGVFAGTNTGPLMTPQGEIAATGRPLSLPYCDVWESSAGRITTHHVYFDQLGMLAQLGLLPEPAAS